MRYAYKFLVASLCAGISMLKVFDANAATASDVATPAPISATEKKAIQEAIRASLKDPESAKFGAMNTGKFSDGNLSVCGWVTGKNSYGGYTGMSPFVGKYFVKSKQIDIAIGSGRDAEFIPGMCLDFGTPLPPQP